MRALVLCLVLGCGGGQAPAPAAPTTAGDASLSNAAPPAARPPPDAPPADDLSEPLATLERFRDEICACKDRACAQRVSDAMAKWSEQNALDQKDQPHFTEDQEVQFTLIGKAIGDCLQAAEGGSASPAP